MRRIAYTLVAAAVLVGFTPTPASATCGPICRVPVLGGILCGIAP